MIRSKKKVQKNDENVPKEFLLERRFPVRNAAAVARNRAFSEGATSDVLLDNMNNLKRKTSEEAQNTKNMRQSILDLNER